MNILLITWNYPPKIGGMEMMQFQLVQNLPPHYKVDVIAPGARRLTVPAERATVHRANGTSLSRFILFAVIQAFRLSRKNSYELVVAGSALLCPIVWMLGRVFKLRTVVHVYGLDLIYPNPIYQFLLKTFLPKCDRLLAISNGARVAARDRNVDPSRIAILNPGVDFSEFAKQPDTLGLKERYGLVGKKVILFAGRLARRKGVLPFISHALPQILNHYPDAVLVIAGGNANQSLAHGIDMESAVREEISRLELGANVQVLGRVPRADLIELYNVCDVFVLPAIEVNGDMEGFGIVLMEANAAGKPVVSTRLGGIIDAVDDGRSGLLVSAGCWDEMAETVLQLLDDDEKARRLGEHGRRRAKEKFDWPRTGRRYAELLSGVV